MNRVICIPPYSKDEYYVGKVHIGLYDDNKVWCPTARALLLKEVTVKEYTEAVEAHGLVNDDEEVYKSGWRFFEVSMD